MGHKSYHRGGRRKNVQGKQEEEMSVDVDRAQHVPPQLRQLNKPSSTEILEEVSRRMGELLLQGYTMLDEYCDICGGILMEYRTSGQRICVKCNVLKAKMPERKSQWDGDTSNSRSDTFRTVSTSSSKYSGGSRTSMRSRQSPLNGTRKEDSCSSSKTAARIQEAVESKIEWCANRLETTESALEVSHLFDAIDKGMEIMNRFNKYSK